MAYTVYSNFSGAGQAPDLERIQKARKVRARAESVYSNFQDPGQDLSRWRIQYTRIFRGRAGSRSGAYTIYSKSLGPGRICILKFSGAGQAPDLERIQKARKVRAWAESVYSNFQGQSKLSVDSVYRKLEEPGLGRTCILKNSVLGQVPGLERIQDTRKNWPWAESVYSNFQGQGRLPIWGVYKKLEKSRPR